MFGDLLHFAHTCAFYHYYLIGVSIISLIINLFIFYDDHDLTLENLWNTIVRTIIAILGALAAYYLFFILIGLFITLFYILGILFIIALLILFAL